MKKFAVIGNPVSHSLSPVIHQQFAKQFDINLEYLKIHAEAGEFDEKINTFKANGGCGLNVTVPYKILAFSMSETLSRAAALAKSVNTLSFDQNHISGDNTDGTGLINDLKINQGLSLADKRVLILGAGGAVSGVIAPLLAEQPDLVLIANRTVEKAVGLEKQFSQLGPVKGCGLSTIDNTNFDLIINGTATSLLGEVPQVSTNVLERVEFAYDMMYSNQPTAFIEWARLNGVENASDGLGMLVEQAASSFYIWHARQPKTSVVLAHLRKIIGQQ